MIALRRRLSSTSIHRLKAAELIMLLFPKHLYEKGSSYCSTLPNAQAFNFRKMAKKKGEGGFIGLVVKRIRWTTLGCGSFQTLHFTHIEPCPCPITAPLNGWLMQGRKRIFPQSGGIQKCSRSSCRGDEALVEFPLLHLPSPPASFTPSRGF